MGHWMDRIAFLHGGGVGVVWAGSPVTGRIDMGGTARGAIGAGYALEEPGEGSDPTDETVVGVEAMAQASGWYGGSDVLAGGKGVFGSNKLNGGVFAGYQRGPRGHETIGAGAELNFNPFIPTIPFTNMVGLMYTQLSNPLVFNLQVRGDAREPSNVAALKVSLIVGWGY